MNTRGSILTSVLILIVVITLTSAALLGLVSNLAVADVHKDIDAQLLSSANSGLEVCRTMMYFDDPGTFIGYVDYPPPPPTELDNGSGGMVINGCDVVWGVEENPSNPTELKISVTASRRDRSITVYLKVKIPDYGEYSFASNYMHSGWHLGTPQDWYGNLYWYTTDGSHVIFDDLQSFYGTLKSWEFTSLQDTYVFYDSEGNPVPESSVHTEYDYSDPYDRDNFEAFDSDINLGLLFSKTPGDLGFPTTASIRFDAGMAHGLGEDARPKEAEIFLGPDGYIYWRNCGDGPDDWNLVRDSSGTPVEQDGQVLYFEKDVWVRGVVTGQITITSAQDVYINGNIIREDSTTCALGIMAQDDIYWEVRKEFEDGNQTEILDVFSNDHTGDWLSTFYDIYNSGRGSFSHIKTNGLGPQNYIAEPVFDPSNPSHQAFMDSYSEYADQWAYWNGQYAGNVPPETAIEASMYAGDTMGPSAPFHILSYLGNGETFGWRYDSSYYHPENTSWRSSGTYFMGSDWADYVENWQHATYGEHPFASVIRPPGFARLTSGTPVVVPGSYGIVRN